MEIQTLVQDSLPPPDHWEGVKLYKRGKESKHSVSCLGTGAKLQDFREAYCINEWEDISQYKETAGRKGI